VERVVRNGFEDGCLYNDELLKLTDVEINEFKELKGIIGQTKAMGNSGSIDVNSQGLTNEEYEEKERLEKKKKKGRRLTRSSMPNMDFQMRLRFKIEGQKVYSVLYPFIRAKYTILNTKRTCSGIRITLFLTTPQRI